MRETVGGLTGWVVTSLLRDGGQRGARRNAWAAMVEDNRRARARAEAEAAVREGAEDFYARDHGPRSEGSVLEGSVLEGQVLEGQLRQA